jgi:hypothetical protein
MVMVSAAEFDAQGVLEAWKKSGQSLEGYARRRGLVPQWPRWLKQKFRFGAAPDKSRAVALLPVRVAESETGARHGEPRRGTEVASIIYSLLETAKLCNIGAAWYLREAALADARGEALLPTEAHRHSPSSWLLYAAWTTHPKSSTSR